MLHLASRLPSLRLPLSVFVLPALPMTWTPRLAWLYHAFLGLASWLAFPLGLSLEASTLEIVNASQHGHTLRIHPVHDNTTLAYIRASLAKRPGMKNPMREELKLFYKGQLLLDPEATLGEIGLALPGPMVVRRKRYTLWVITPEAEEHKLLTLLPACSVQELKACVQLSLGFPVASQRLFLAQEELLEEDKSLSAYGIAHGTSLHLELKPAEVLGAFAGQLAPPKEKKSGQASRKKKERAPGPQPKRRPAPSSSNPSWKVGGLAFFLGGTLLAFQGARRLAEGSDQGSRAPDEEQNERPTLSPGTLGR